MRPEDKLAGQLTEKFMDRIYIHDDAPSGFTVEEANDPDAPMVLVSDDGTRFEVDVDIWARPLPPGEAS